MYESMFETFLKTAHKNDRASVEERATVDALKKLPPEVLFKIANGETKLAYMCGPTAIGGSSGGLEWVEQFKDTPLFEQALGLEQQSIQLEQMEQQHRAQKDAEREQEPKFWEMQDQVRLQKRMLGLQLASSQLQSVGGGAPPAPPMAAAPGPEMPPPAPAEAAGGPPEAKVAAKKTPEEEQEAPIAHRAGEAVGRHYDTISGVGGSLAGAGIGAALGGVLTGNRIGQLAGGIVGGGLGFAGGRGMGRFAQGVTSGASHAYPHDEMKTAAFDHAADMGRRMAQGDYEKAVTTTSAAEVGQELAKVSFAITEKGHKFDAERAHLEKKQLLEQSQFHQNYRGIGYNDPETNSNPASMMNVLRFGPSVNTPHAHPTIGARHAAYVAAQHERGSNAWNPFGGLMTPLPEEHGATSGILGQVGKVRLKEKQALDMAGVAHMGRQAVGMIGRNPGAAIGAGIGAGGGLAQGLQPDQNGQRHLLRGAAQGVAGGVAGAAVGHGAQHFGQAMMHRPAGVPLMQNIKDSAGAAAKQVGYQASRAAGAAGDSLKKLGPTAPATPYQIRPGFTPPPATPGGGVPALPPSTPTVATRILPASGVAPTIPMSSAVPTRSMPPGRSPGQPSNIIGPMAGAA